MSTSTTLPKLSAVQTRRLCQAYPHLLGRPRYQALARELGVRERDLHELAAELGLNARQPVKAVDDDKIARLRIVEEAGALDDSTQIVMGRRRQARAGDWSERELADAVQASAASSSPAQTAAALGRHASEVRLRLMALGVERQIESDETWTLRQLARRLDCQADFLVGEVLSGRLSASGAGALPDAGWRCGLRQLGAWLVAFPSCPELDGAEPALLIEAAMQVGAQVGRRMAALSQLTAAPDSAA